MRQMARQRYGLGQGPATYGTHAKQFLMARKNSKFYISVLLWFTQKVYWPRLVQKYACCWHTERFETLTFSVPTTHIVGTLNDLKPDLKPTSILMTKLHYGDTLRYIIGAGLQ